MPGTQRALSKGLLNEQITTEHQLRPREQDELGLGVRALPAALLSFLRCHVVDFE